MDDMILFSQSRHKFEFKCTGIITVSLCSSGVSDIANKKHKTNLIGLSTDQQYIIIHLLELHLEPILR